MGAIVWLASFPKSGNTWVRHYLHALLNEGKQSINAMNTLTVGDASANWYRPHLKRAIELCSDEEIAAVRQKALRGLAAQSDGLVFVKTHNALVSHLGVPMIDGSVTAGVIYVVRNPFDVVISLASFQGTTIDVAIDEMVMQGAMGPTSEKFAYQYFGSWAEHVESWTRRPMRQLHVMRYEDMLDEPFSVFTDLAKFLRIPASPSAIRTAIKASSFDKLRKEEEEQGFIERPDTADRFFREGKAGQWRDVLSIDQIKRITDALGPQMSRFGYLP